jgi:hypothetical protein
MTEFPTTGIFWIDLFIATAVTGTLAAAGLTALANFVTQKRQQYIDLCKYKIEKLKDAAPYYARLANSCLSLAAELETSLR